MWQFCLPISVLFLLTIVTSEIQGKDRQDETLYNPKLQGNYTAKLPESLEQPNLLEQKEISETRPGGLK